MRIAIAAALALCACSGPPLPTHGTVGDFRLTAHTGAEFNSRELQGKVWVANFIFTNCMGPCPRMTSQMRKLQQAFADQPGFRLVTFTIDPRRDTPPVLQAYAKRHNADLSRWSFLTGPVEELHRLKREKFLLGDVDGTTLEHSTRFVLVDAKGRIRGFYPVSEQAELDKLIADARSLVHAGT